MTADDPMAFFITWTVYGTHLQGDERGWRRRRKGEQPPQPLLVRWRHGRLKHDVIPLSHIQREIVEQECRRHCGHRAWKAWAVNARSNHVHVVVSAAGSNGGVVRDQLKANCTRALRERWAVFRSRPVWTAGGDWQCINSADELEAVCVYVSESQDRMEHKEHKPRNRL